MTTVILSTTSYENGKATVRNFSFDCPPGTILNRLTVAADGSTLLNIPFALDDYEDDEDTLTLWELEALKGGG